MLWAPLISTALVRNLKYLNPSFFSLGRTQDPCSQGELSKASGTHSHLPRAAAIPRRSLASPGKLLLLSAQEMNAVWLCFLLTLRIGVKSSEQAAVSHNYVICTIQQFRLERTCRGLLVQTLPKPRLIPKQIQVPQGLVQLGFECFPGWRFLRPTLPVAVLTHSQLEKKKFLTCK